MPNQFQTNSNQACSFLALNLHDWNPSKVEIGEGKSFASRAKERASNPPPRRPTRSTTILSFWASGDGTATDVKDLDATTGGGGAIASTIVVVVDCDRSDGSREKQSAPRPTFNVVLPREPSHRRQAAGSLNPSQILDKVKGFLGVIAEANDKLELDVREVKHVDYDIEVLSGNEKEYIEMDLLLGVADLHNAEAVAAAEAALSGLPPSVPSISASSSNTDDDNDEKDASCSSEKLDADEAESVRGNKQKKRPKIVVLDSSSG
ncbi:hypothetical protein Cni_G28491 [Canna indica]|uniref:Uncharacterized protein n=1 Tax=Canna indica TaxID=4628 RepID=A0AAQ3L3J6_9LILI|nr:hypothetical protein Cni_G28491 [Canna indica]